MTVSQPWTPAWIPERAAAVPPPPRPRYKLALALLGLTFLCCTTFSPAIYLWSRTDVQTDLVPFPSPEMVLRVWRDPDLLRLGLSFSIPVLLILFAHEMGHYIACRRYGLSATLPYFLPVPAMFGTLGAFIRIRSPIRTKRELFDVGIAGPLAGFVVLLPFLFYGIARSEPAILDPGPAGSSLLVPGRCLAIQLATLLFHGRLGEGMTLNLHPFALAAWFGLLATALNLIPLGQFDGGHILYAVSGRWQRRLAPLLWVGLGLAGFRWPGWWLWSLIALAIGLFHPVVRNEAEPLDPRRRGLAVVALIVLILSFTPQAITEVSSAPLPERGTGMMVSLTPR